MVFFFIEMWKKAEIKLFTCNLVLKKRIQKLLPKEGQRFFIWRNDSCRVVPPQPEVRIVLMFPKLTSQRLMKSKPTFANFSLFRSRIVSMNKMQRFAEKFFSLIYLRLLSWLDFPFECKLEENAFPQITN